MIIHNMEFINKKNVYNIITIFYLDKIYIIRY